MKWTELLRRLGAAEPADWVDDEDDVSTAREQLHRFLFLREATRYMASTRDFGWIDNQLAFAERDPTGPMAGGGLAIASMLAKGVEKAEIAELVRATQAAAIFDLCYQLSGGDFDVRDQELAEQAGLGPLGWALVTVDEKEEPGDMIIAGLHESVLASDPEGREMRPRDQA